MKKFPLVFLSALLFQLAQSQDCKTALYMTANAKIEMTLYDKKGEVSGKQKIQVTNVKKTGAAYESTISNAMEDKKGKVISTANGAYKCNGGVLSADMKMFVPQEQMGKAGEAEATFEPVYLEYPAAPAVGESLKNAEFKMDIKMNGGMNTSITFKEENRKVAGKETVTSTAGTWEAYVISYDGSMKTKMGGIGLPGFNFSAKEWYVPGMGIVKTESYNKGGKLLGSTLLTAITK